MYRGSSFLLQNDYRIHCGAVKIIMDAEYKSLWSIKCSDMDDNYQCLEVLVTRLRDYYRSFRSPKIKSEVSDVLITKILLGTLGCVPAYDEFFVGGLRDQGVSPMKFGRESLAQLSGFYIENEHDFENVLKRINKNDRGIVYPQMKLLDMGFLQIGFNA